MAHEGVMTAWGPAQTVTELAPGIVFYTTASHGGIRLDAEHQNKIAGIMARNFLSSLEWWEEDSDWSVPYAFFWSEIAPRDPEYPRMIVAALRTIFAMHREVIGKFGAPNLRALRA